MKDCHAAKTPWPVPVNHNLSLLDCYEVVDPYLARPDLDFAVTYLSRYLHKPGKQHLHAVLQHEIRESYEKALHMNLQALRKRLSKAASLDSLNTISYPLDQVQGMP